MSDIFKNLKSLFIEEDENAAKGDNASAPKEKKSKPTSTPAPIDMSTISSPPGEATAKFSKVLLDAIQKANLDGFDYLEYKNSLKSLSKMDMDDATRYKSAFAMAQTMGATKKKLIDSAKHYQSVLSTEKSHFEKAVEQQMQVKVVGRKEEMKVWEQEIIAKEQQIKKLQKDIDALKTKLNKVSNTLDNEAQKVKKTQLDFIASHDHIYQQIEADIKKMTEHLS